MTKSTAQALLGKVVRRPNTQLYLCENAKLKAQSLLGRARRRPNAQLNWVKLGHPSEIFQDFLFCRQNLKEYSKDLKGYPRNPKGYLQNLKGY